MGFVNSINWVNNFYREKNRRNKTLYFYSQSYQYFPTMEPFILKQYPMSLVQKIDELLKTDKFFALSN